MQRFNVSGYRGGRREVFDVVFVEALKLGGHKVMLRPASLTAARTGNGT
jgi:hypothetical protein